MKIIIGPDDGIENIIAKLTGELLKYGASEEDTNECQIIIDEFYANIRSYVFPGSLNPFWTLSIFLGHGSVSFIIEYEGPYFHSEPPEPMAYRPVEARPTGGLGLLLVSELSDELSFRYENGINVITVKKRLSPAP